MRSSFSRRLALVLWLLCLATPTRAALPAAGVWEVRAATGSDNNGGGIDAATVVTDYSQQAAAQLSETDLATTGVVTTLTSATGGFTAAMVGNFIHITSGTNFTPGWYEVTARASTNSVTLDRAPSTAAGSAGVGALGGALATLGTLSGAMVASNRAFITGAFTTTAPIAFAQSVASPTGANPFTQINGYGAARGDAVHATLALSTTTGVTILSVAAGFSVVQLDIDGGSLTGSRCFAATGANVEFRFCKASSFATRAFQGGANNGVSFLDCEATGGTAAVADCLDCGGSSCNAARCFVHDNAGIGISMALNSVVAWNIVCNNTGASSDGIQVSAGCWVHNNTVHNNGGNGISNINNMIYGNLYRNNILSNNGKFGISGSSSGAPASPDYDGNAFFSNTSGTRALMDSLGGAAAVNPYVNTRDVTLAASPYIGPTTGSTANFGLNDVPGGGQACRRAGSPGTWPGNTGTTGYLDFGAVQSRSNIRTPRAAPPPKPKKKAVRR